MLHNLLRQFLTLGAIIGTLPFNIVDGQVIDAVPVMGDLNFIVSQVNANVPSLIGTNTFVNSGATGGTANAITLTPTPAIVGYTQGQQFTFVPFAVNTGAVTVAVSGLAPRALKYPFGANLTGEELQVGGVYTIVDNGTNYVLQNASQGMAMKAFTPTLAFAGASVGITYATQTGWYAKVGPWVNFDLSVVLTNKGSSTGRIEIGNLPYPISATWVDAVDPLLATDLTFAGNYCVFSYNFGGVTLAVLEVTTAGTFTVLDDTACANTTAFACRGAYPTI